MIAYRTTLAMVIILLSSAACFKITIDSSPNVEAAHDHGGAEVKRPEDLTSRQTQICLGGFLYWREEVRRGRNGWGYQSAVYGKSGMPSVLVPVVQQCGK